MHFLYCIILVVYGFPSEYPLFLLKEINLIRSAGCPCGDQYMPPVNPLVWSVELEQTARQHAQDMHDNNYFSHYNQVNQDVSIRADSVHYEWNQIGENIAKGYLSDYEVLRAWIESPAHCEMIMYSFINEMGASRVGDYWVVNFGNRNLNLTTNKITYR